MNISAPLLLSLVVLVVGLTLMISSSSSSFFVLSSSGCGHSHPAIAQQKMYYLSKTPLKAEKTHNQNTNNNNNNRNAKQQSVTSWNWRLATGMQRNMTLVTNPAADKDIVTELPRSCSSTGQTIYVGGQNSGFDCFNAQGQRVYQNFCNLYCLANETLNSTHTQRLDQLVNEAAQFFQSNRMQVWDSENASLKIVSDETNNCAGMSINTDTVYSVVLAVTTRPTRQLGSINAHASACQLLEMNNRPILIHLNVDPAIVRPEAGYTDTELKEIIIHQITHGLGFSNHSYPLFRHPDDPSKTYYEQSSTTYPTGPISSSATTGLVNLGSGNFYLNQTEIVDGQKIYFKGPSVLKVARSYFNCPSLPVEGIELENGGGSERITGCHWEKRLFLNEQMIGTRSWESYYSAFTLALLQDTGYLYFDDLVNRSFTDITEMNFGRSAGCNFLSQKCNQWPTTLDSSNSQGSASASQNENYFCSQTNLNGCGFDRSYIGVCNAITWTNPLPEPYRYFSDNINRGGQDELMDYCPVMRLMTSGECNVATNEKIFHRDIESGMSFGDYSRCFVTNVLNSSVISNGNTFGACYKSFCHHDASQGAFIVVGREAVRCTKDNEIIELFPPARFNVNDFVPESSTDTIVLSYTHHGIVQCSSLYSECQAQRAQTTAYKNRPTKTKLANVTSTFPTITSVYPPWGDPTGGTMVTIIGTTLDRCSAGYVGGVKLSDFVILNDTAVRGRLGNVGTVYGGPKAENGEGDALVSVQCRLLEFPYCAEQGGCILARTKGVFNYSLTDPNAAPENTGVFSDFFDSTGGKVVGIVMCVLVIIVLIVVARLCFKDGEKVGPKYKTDGTPASNNNNNDNINSNPYQSPAVTDNINLAEDGLFTPTNDDNDLAQSNYNNNTNSGADEELEPVVVMI